MKSNKREDKENDYPLPYISPNELAERWCCARSTVDRIAAIARLKKIYLGEGKNGIVRYNRQEVEAYEASRTVK